MKVLKFRKHLCSAAPGPTQPEKGHRSRKPRSAAGSHGPQPKALIPRQLWRLRRFYTQHTNGGGPGSRAGVVLQARRASGHEPRLRTPHPSEPARSVPPRPRPGPARFGRVTAPDSRSAPRRDDYDKKVKQAAKEKARRRHTPAPTRPRKPDLQVYLPRHRDGSTHPVNPDREEASESSSSGSSELEPPGRQLFCLDYEADSGEVTSVIVYQDDDPGRVSEAVSAHTPLDPAMREALRSRIQEELAKRQSRH